MKYPPQPKMLKQKTINTLSAPEFSCVRCGKCCTEGGLVYFTPQEVTRAAEFLGLPRKVFISHFLIKIKKVYAHEVKDSESCIFLQNNRCRINSVKPSQCATFPYWETYFDKEGRLVNFDRQCPGFGCTDEKK